ncbi:histone-like nucleoid-structuring protein Lsr2 [Rhodococcoides fascians]|uniref:histone-like nucleoid-structuring protein Lsr2 n=1 Tax=Rhodococcoides fascians TaxID=1828 RepID=UPI00050CE8CE|nr:Lsr2 family protein [Rhodococcus fascians]
MARIVSVELVDDIDGTVIEEGAGETVEFAVGGVEYVIDLKTKNANEFHRKLDYYIRYATRTGGRKRKPSSSGAAASSPTAASASPRRDPAQVRAIRQWAADEGYEISDRGRIPAHIEDAFNDAHR